MTTLPVKITTWLYSRQLPCFTFTKAHAREVESALPGVQVQCCQGEEEFRNALPETEIALVWRFKQDMFALCPQLVWIATPAAGKDYFSVTPPASLWMTNGSFHGELMGETALAMMLAASRGLLAAHSLQRAHPWPRPELASVMRPLRGAHLAILGFGRIGQWIGQLAKPFGVKITGIRRQPTTAPEWFTAEDSQVHPTEMDALLPTVDHLCLTLPRSNDTDHMIDADRLRRLPAHAWVYNLGRGNAVDEAALANALAEGTIAGAGLDVFEEEPLKLDSPLRQAPNVLLMPHSSAFSPNYMDLFVNEFVQCYQGRFGLEKGS